MFLMEFTAIPVYIHLYKFSNSVHLIQTDNLVRMSVYQRMGHGFGSVWPRLWQVPHSNHCPSVCLSVCQQTLTLVITFDWLVLDLSYFTCVFLLARPFIWYHDLDPLIFDRGVWNLWRGPFWLNQSSSFLLQIVSMSDLVVTLDLKCFILLYKIKIRCWVRLVAL
jgi:hypothetical protein